MSMLAARRELRAMRMVLTRELLHFTRDRARSAIGLLQPLLFLFVLGVGLSHLIEGATGGATRGYVISLYPGVLVMAVQLPAISAGASIVWDRESGFLREMLVAPVSRASLLAGKCAGGAVVATAQGLVVLGCAGMIGVPYDLGLIAVLAAELALTAFTLTTLGSLVAVAIPRPQTFNAVMSVLMTPLVFLSGLMFPITAMPGWVSAASLANPLTYAVDALRHTVTARLGASPAAALFPPLAWGGWRLPAPVELAVLAAAAALALAVASRRFARLE